MRALLLAVLLGNLLWPLSAAAVASSIDSWWQSPRSDAQCHAEATRPVGAVEVAADGVERNRQLCLRSAYTLAATADPQQPLALQLRAMGAWELAVDGRVLARSGVIGDSPATEQPGQMHSSIVLPDWASRAGTHAISLRLSNFHVGADLRFLRPGFELVPLRDALQSPLRDQAASLLAAGAVLAIAFYCLLLHLLDRRHPATLLFALLCLALVALFAAESSVQWFDYRYDWQVPRLRAVLALSAAVAVLLPAFYWRHFALPRRRGAVLIALGLGGACLLLPSFDAASLGLLLVGLASALVVSLWAWRRGQGEARWGVLALLPCLLALLLAPRAFQDIWLFRLFPLVLLGQLLHLSIGRRQLRKQALAALRLENELLRRQLQPHYLLNSLSALQEWVETDAPRASRFIDALAQQLRGLFTASALPCHALADEMALCEAELQVMGLRRGHQYRLRMPSPLPALGLPPALLQTLIENAFMHNRIDHDAEFVLQIERCGSDALLTLDSPCDRDRRHQGSGVGERYVRARLSERHGRRWQLSSSEVDGRRSDRIVLPWEPAP